jgi:hypothetical protein
MTLTLKKLHTEGRLSLGDTITHSDHGDCELVCVVDRNTVLLKTSAGEYVRCVVDFGSDAHIVPVNTQKERL